MMPLQARAPRTAESEAALPAEQVRALLDYDPETGVIRWKIRRRVGGGIVAGTLCLDGHTRITVNRQSFVGVATLGVIMLIQGIADLAAPATALS